jgi:arginine repressor
MALFSMALIILISACSKNDNDTDKQPQIIAFSPAAGATDTMVTITGNNFSNDKSTITVRFGTVAATDIVSATSSEIKVKVPKAALPGKVKIAVTVAGKESTSADDFTIEAATWKKVFGGNDYDYGRAIWRTADGGYVTAGRAYSNNNGDVGPNKGFDDIWIIKTDANGNKIWQKTYGGAGDEDAWAITGTADGGFIVAGTTTSNNNGDVGPTKGFGDIWILKLDANGNLLWQKTFGGNADEFARSVISNPDGTFIVAGYTGSNNSGDVGVNHGSGTSDFWILKLDASGNLLWQKTLGGTGSDFAVAVTGSADGGYVIAGYTNSNNSGDVGANHGSTGNDMWVVKLDANGNLVWQKTLGGTGSDNANCITRSTDGGFVVAGGTNSNNSGQVGTNHGMIDMWVVKLDGSGNLQWQKTMGGADNDYANAIITNTDGSFVIAGGADSDKSGDVGANHGNMDFWVVKLQANGTLAGQQLLGGDDSEYSTAITAFTGGGYVITGYTDSNNSGDVGINHGGHYDMWVVKINEL